MTTRLPLANLLVGSAVVAAAFATAACSGSGSTPAVTPDAITPTIASTVVDGGSDGLAAELLLAGTGDPGRAQWHQEQRPVSDPDVAAALDALALDHVRSTVLGAAGGPNLVGSALVRRLAGATTAPPDSNGRSGNLDETLRAEAERVLAFAGAAPPGLETVPVLPWQSRSAELAAALTPADNTSWATLDLGQQGVRLADVARFLELRITVARRLLGELRRTYYGRDAAAGALGLLAVQQALAAEDALFSGVFTAGGPLGALVAPAEYDPLTAPRWLPAEFAVDLDPAVAGAPAGYAPLEGASDLAALGAMLRAGVELSELGDPTAGPALPGLFRFRPFAPPPSEPVIPVLSWDSEMRGFLRFHCGECHYDEQFGGYSIRSYEEMRTPGFTAESLNLQIVVPGDHEASLLHQIVTNAPFPFTQMPLGGQLLAPEIELIDRWIDEGAVESSPEPPAPPQPGDDLAVVSFRNLAALHFDAATGALHHRVEANGPADFTPSGLATATATGRTLRGLAAFVRRRPDEELAGRTAMQYFDAIVGFASRHQVDPEGAAYDAVEIFTGAPAGPAADLRGQAAMAAGLLAAAAQLPAQSPVHAAAGRAARYLLDAFDAGGDLFGERAGEPAT
ncbi:MAG: hypothetical protein KDE27_15240, partial [Planctomycetes bacterium]|nr:hypothetical protein [Planctomycetota bacterium]